jgi:hypothetical protein
MNPRDSFMNPHEHSRSAKTALCPLDHEAREHYADWSSLTVVIAW